MGPIVWVPLSRLQSDWDWNAHPCTFRLEMIPPRIGGEQRDRDAHTHRPREPQRLAQLWKAGSTLPEAHHVQFPRVPVSRLTSLEAEDSTVAVCAACRADPLGSILRTAIFRKAEWAAQVSQAWERTDTMRGHGRALLVLRMKVLLALWIS